MTKSELLANAEMARADRLTIEAGTPGIALMERAGVAVADAAAEVAGAPPSRVAVLCGPGNNGGDGFVAARLLRERGYDVALGLLGEVGALKGDAEAAARRFGGPVESALELDFERADVVIDALFGAGLSRDIDGAAKALVDKLNIWSRAGKAVLAVDVPSGVDGDTGAVRGVAVTARSTVAFFRFKPGHLLLPGRELCGEARLADIGVSENTLAEIAPKTFANTPDVWRSALPALQTQGHKYTRGHALVMSGPAWSTGAARLSARGALRGGAGLVTLASRRDAHLVNATQLTAIMIAACDGPAELERLLGDQRVNAVVLGPGLGVGEATADLVAAALLSSAPGRSLVLDADVLTTFAGRAGLLASRIKACGMPVFLTPHEGEFARLFNDKGSKLDRARRAAETVGATILLKGPDTVVAHPDGRASICFDAPPWLATAGSGDVLAGILAGLLAQGMPAFQAASAAVWMHGAAARAFGPGLIAEDIPEKLPEIWRWISDSQTVGNV